MELFQRSLFTGRIKSGSFGYRLFPLVIASILFNPVFAQNLPEVPLKYPWAGGMNSCQFGSIDLNFDGKSDLVIFDRRPEARAKPWDARLSRETRTSPDGRPVNVVWC